MTIKEKLREIKELDRRIDILLRQIEDERERIKAVDYSADKVSGGIGTDLSAKIEIIDKYNKQLDRQIDELYDKKQKLKVLVDSRLQGVHWDVINLYYFSKGYTWEQVAVELHFSGRQIRRFHGQALLKLG